MIFFCSPIWDGSSNCQRAYATILKLSLVAADLRNTAKQYGGERDFLYKEKDVITVDSSFDDSAVPLDPCLLEHDQSHISHTQ